MLIVISAHDSEVATCYDINNDDHIFCGCHKIQSETIMRFKIFYGPLFDGKIN